MKRLIIIAILIISAFAARSQDIDSSELAVKKLVDSAFSDLTLARGIKDLPQGGEYYIAKIKLMNGTIKKLTFYDADSTSIFVFTDTTNELLDTIYASEIKFISFREKGRTGKVIGGAAGSGLFIGAIAGYVSAPCDDCEEGDLSFPGLGRGAVWGLVGGVALGTVGAVVSVFNNADIKINGNPRKFLNHYPKLRKLAVKNR